MTSRGHAGFSLVELLIASLVTIVVIGAALTLVAPAQRMFQVHPEQADVQQRVRVAVAGLHKALMMAGAGPYAGPAAGPLNSVLAPVMPFRAFGDAPDQAGGVFFRPDAISILYVPSTASQTRLTSALPAGAFDPVIDNPPNCPAATSQQVCGFEAGDRVLLADEAGHWDVFSVDSVVNGAMTLQHRGAPSATRYPAGTIVTEIRAATYSLKFDSRAGTSHLALHDGWATELPVVDEVVAFELRYVGEPDPPQLRVATDGTLAPRATYGPAPPPAGTSVGTWPDGENCIFAVSEGTPVPRLQQLGPGPALVELTAGMVTDGPWCPDVHAPNRFDADLLRVRRVHVLLRVQSAVASLRGPAGILFARGGTARAGDRMVPDMVVRFDVTPRNLGR